jgi:hypothetical protein
MAEGDEPANKNHGNFYLCLDLRAEVDLAPFLCRSEIGSLASGPQQSGVSPGG